MDNTTSDSDTATASARPPRADKVAVVTEVRERFADSAAVLLTEYRGIDVSAMATLRRSLREAGGEYKVYKNTLVRRAVSDLGIDGLEELLVGPTALAFVSGDAAAVAKALKTFRKDNDNLVIKGGILGDSLMDESQVLALADLPSRDELLARLAGGFAAPMQQMAALMNAVIAKFGYGLQALIEAGGAPGAPETVAPTEGTPSEESPEATSVEEPATETTEGTAEAEPTEETGA